MQENIYSDIWGETLHKKGIGTRVYLYSEDAGKNKLPRYHPSLILDNKLAIENTIKFLQAALKEIHGGRQ